MNAFEPLSWMTCAYASLADILEDHAEQALPEKVNALISRMTVETLSLRPNMLVNVTPEPVR